MIRILGIDPGLQCTGWGIIEAQNNHVRYVDSGIITPPPKLPMSRRLHILHEGLAQVISTYQPGECAMEETFLNSNAASSLKLGQARGALLLTMAMSGLEVREYAPLLIKKSVVGVGRAEKHQVLQMVKLLLPGCEVTSEDAADSLAVAICHNSHRKWAG
jgi:crossover junction endodeoxyribonuclease RuvC